MVICVDSCFCCSCLSPWLLKHCMHLCKMNPSTSKCHSCQLCQMTWCLYHNFFPHDFSSSLITDNIVKTSHFWCYSKPSIVLCWSSLSARTVVVCKLLNEKCHVFLWVCADTFLSCITSSFRHYLIISAVTNLLVNLLGVWFFRSYARVNIGIEATCMPPLVVK